MPFFHFLSQVILPSEICDTLSFSDFSIFYQVKSSLTHNFKGIFHKFCSYYACCAAFTAQDLLCLPHELMGRNEWLSQGRMGF